MEYIFKFRSCDAKGVSKPLHDFWRVSLTDSHFQKQRDVLLIKKRKISNLGTLEERLEATAVGP